MKKKLFSLDDETLGCLSALMNPAQIMSPYASESEAIRAAIQLLHGSIFHPSSTASDVVLLRIEKYCSLAIGVARGELERREGEEWQGEIL